MNRVKLQGRAPTLRDQQRAGMPKNSYGSSVDFAELRELVNSRQFVGPPVPLWLRSDMQSDVKAERERSRYWQLVADLKRFGRCEFSNHGTPFLGDAFGYGQSIEVNQ